MEIIKPSGEPDYIGAGEVMNVLSMPSEGKTEIELDGKEKLFTEEKYISLPFGYVISKTGEVNNKVVLSFDDGPDAKYTPQIIDILQRYKVPAVFFVMGASAEANIPLLRKIYKSGFEIGNHTFTHPNILEISDDRLFLELRSTRRLIEA